MEKRIMPVLTPDFYKDFHCVAADCRHNCCVHPWFITIDKKNYKELRLMKEPKWLADDLGSYVKRNPNSKGAGDYAYAVFNERGCAMQTEEGLCRLQMDVGAHYLSTTCRSYPRQITLIHNKSYAEVTRENSLSLSCEEVVRMLLHKPEPIQFEATEEQFYFGMTGLNSSIEIESRPILVHYHLIRAVCIALLQNRDYRIEQRLMLLVLYLDKLVQAERDGTEDSIPAVTDTFVTAVEEKLYDKMLAAAGGSVATTAMSNITFALAFARYPQHPIIQRCNENIKADDYVDRCESYRAFTADKVHILEHLLVMELFGKALPFHKPQSIMENAQYLASIFTIFRFMLGAYLGASHDLPEQEFIDVMAFFGKSILHDSGSYERNTGLLKNNGMDTLPYLMSIILG